MRFHPRFTAFVAFGFGFALHTAAIQAESFDWTNITYAPTPTVAQTQQSLGAGGSNNTLSIKFTLNNGATFLPTTTVQSPAVDAYNTNTTYYTSGGNAATARYLQICANMVNSTNGIGSITVDLFFAKPVTNLTFSLFDVDINATGGNPYTDQIRTIVGFTPANAPVYASNVTGSASNTVAGTGSAYTITANANNANNLAAANAAVTFGVTPINHLSFVYGDNYTGAGTHGTAQIIALSNLNFTSVPEPGAAACLALGAAGLAGAVLRRRR